MDYLIRQGVRPDPIMKGLKIISMEASGIRMLDSMAFLPMALSQFPRCFGLTELAKGHFPHLANTLENEDMDLPHLPAKELYCPGQMRPGPRKKFDAWYEEHKDDRFLLRDELIRYCRSDVRILMQALLRFRKLFIGVTGVDPYTYTTIASCCLATFRTNFLKENTIGLTPLAGYDYHYHYSKISIKWLKWESQQRGIRIQHAKNGGEAYVCGGRLRADGFSDEENTIFEFQVCLFDFVISIGKLSGSQLKNNSLGI